MYARSVHAANLSRVYTTARATGSFLGYYECAKTTRHLSPFVDHRLRSPRLSPFHLRVSFTRGYFSRSRGS